MLFIKVSLLLILILNSLHELRIQKNIFSSRISNTRTPSLNHVAFSIDHIILYHISIEEQTWTVSLLFQWISFIKNSHCSSDLIKGELYGERPKNMLSVSSSLWEYNWTEFKISFHIQLDSQLVFNEPS